LFFIVGVDPLIKDSIPDEDMIPYQMLQRKYDIVSDVTTQVNTVQTASVPDKLDEFKQQSTTVRNNKKHVIVTVPNIFYRLKNKTV